MWLFEGAVEFDGWCEGRQVPLDSQRYKRGSCWPPRCHQSTHLLMTFLPRRQPNGPGHVPRSILPLSAPPPFHPPYVGSHPAPGGSQHRTPGPGMNVPAYMQPYGGPATYGNTAPYGGPAPYGGTPPHALFHHPHLAPYGELGKAQPQAQGYGHYPAGPLPNPGPQPGATQPQDGGDVRAGARGMAGESVGAGNSAGTGTGAGAVSSAGPKKTCPPNPEISPGGMS
jgi:hypothetical protein